jgi:hypothetical protein
MTKNEIMLIEDTFTFILPSMQPRTKTMPPLWKMSTLQQWQEYAELMVSVLREWLKPRRHIAIELITGHPDLVLVGIKVQRSLPSKQVKIVESTHELNDVLSKINKSLERKLSRNITLMPDLKIIVDKTLYLIKPKAMKYWTRTSALNDADTIILDIQLPAYPGEMRRE